MESLFNYTTDEQLIFNFRFDITKKNELKLTFQKINKNNTITDLPYISVYNFDFINERLSKFTHFNTINDFRQCLMDNLSKKTLFVKPPYKNTIDTIWKIFPKELNKKNSFTLISTSNYDKGLSLIFFGENNKSKNIIEVIEEIIQKKK